MPVDMLAHRIAVIVLLASFAAACGGGGGDEPAPATPLLDEAAAPPLADGAADAVDPEPPIGLEVETGADAGDAVGTGDEREEPGSGEIDGADTDTDTDTDTDSGPDGSAEGDTPEPSTGDAGAPDSSGGTPGRSTGDAQAPGSSGDPVGTDGGGEAIETGATGEPEPPATSELDAASPTARYAVTLENFWNADDFPQDFPDDAHLSFVGGATHNASVSFWEPGAVVTPGVEDMAETGRIELLLDEDVRPAIEAGLADSTIAERRYVDPQIDGVPGTLAFEIVLARAFPRVTLLTMLGPSPDWFVGTDGVPLLVDERWLDTLVVELPLMDAGTKSNVTPVMHGPGIHPPDPVGTIAYDPANGTYQPSEMPQIVARVVFERTR